MQTAIFLRPALPADSPALSELHRTVWGSETSDSPVPEMAWVAEAGQQVVGYAELTQPDDLAGSTRYRLRMLVHPAWQGQGIGRRLAQWMREEWQGRGATDILTGTSETQGRAQEFLAQQGFSEVIRFLDSELDIPRFLFPERKWPPGFQIMNLAELVAQWGEDAAWHAYHDIYEETRHDIPRSTPWVPLPFDVMRSWAIQSDFFPEGVLFAVHQSGELAALTELRRTADPKVLETGFTGTRQPWRRRGLCRALKLGAIEVATLQGVTSLRTTNASTNAAMLILNRQLGFEPRPAWIEFKWSAS